MSVIKAEINIFSFLLCRYGHMIDNVVLIVTGTLHERDVQELLEKCHPLGMFDRYPDFYAFINILMSAHRILILLLFSCGILLSIATLAVAQNMRELYRLVLVDTPLAPYFSECITSEVNHLSRKHLFRFILFNINQCVVLIVVEL
jgi:V-type H+-transporting ATPase subunit d